MKNQVNESFKRLIDNLAEPRTKDPVKSAQIIADCILIARIMAEIPESEITDDMLDALKGKPKMIQLALIAIAAIPLEASAEGEI